MENDESGLLCVYKEAYCTDDLHGTTKGMSIVDDPHFQSIQLSKNCDTHVKSHGCVKLSRIKSTKMKRTHLAKKRHPHFRRRVGNYDVVNTNLAKKLCENSDVRFSFCSVKVNYVKLIADAVRKQFDDHGSNEVDA